jgi:hypothetical protein
MTATNRTCILIFAIDAIRSKYQQEVLFVQQLCYCGMIDWTAIGNLDIGGSGHAAQIVLSSHCMDAYRL